MSKINEVIEYLMAFGMSKEKAEENVRLLLENDDYEEFYENICRQRESNLL